MQSIANGKDEVIHFLQNDSLRLTNEQSGVYALMRDDAGQLVLVIEGFTFFGQGTLSLSGNQLRIVNGRAIKNEKPS